MTSPIQQNNSLSHLQSSRLCSQSPQKGYSSYSEAMSLCSAADISFTTAEGDHVTLSSSHEQGYALFSEKWISPLQQSMTFTASMLSSDAYRLDVTGDLSEQELADIGNLMADLSSIADSFFSGNLNQAMTQALNMADMGSIDRLSASFSYEAAWTATSQIVDYHPVPASASLENYFADLPDLIDQAHTDEMKYAEQLQAQWKQIKEYLEARSTDLSTASSDSPSSQDKEDITTARQMMNRVRQTLASHPRLAPFTTSLVHEAIGNQNGNSGNPSLFARKDMLKDNFLQEFSDWMYEA